MVLSTPFDVVRDPQQNDWLVRRTVPNDAVEMAR